VSGGDLRQRILAAARAVEDARDELCRLDAVAGDGDHGVTMALGARAVTDRLKAAPDATGAELVTLTALGMASVGGAIGPLWASGLARVVGAVRGGGGADELPTVGTLRAAAEAFEVAIAALGQAAPGDKTILDAVHPVVDSLRRAEAAGDDLQTAMLAASAAATAGARATAELPARAGRASRLGDLGRGTPDPGATSFALILAALVGGEAVAGRAPSPGAARDVPLVGTSWKMNLTSSEAAAWFEVAVPLLAAAPPCQTFVLPPFTSIWLARERLSGTPVAWGAQDVHPEEAGAHTGDISAAMLADLGCRFVEIGHSERRRDHGETDEMIARKVRAVLRHGMRPVLCVGEPSRLPTEATIGHVREQVQRDLARLDAAEVPEVVLAYEPVWAIGAGAEAAEPSHIGEVQRELHDLLASMSSAPGTVIYGGSVDEDSAPTIVSEAGVDGLFVGRAALDPRRFAAIVTAAATTRMGG
jgi:triosephosphate isomerase